MVVMIQVVIDEWNEIERERVCEVSVDFSYQLVRLDGYLSRAKGIRRQDFNKDMGDKLRGLCLFFLFFVVVTCEIAMFSGKHDLKS